MDLNPDKPDVKRNCHNPSITLLPKDFNYFKQKGFSKEAETYISIGFRDIPGFFFEPSTKQRAEKIYQEALSEKIPGFALMRMSEAAVLGHIKAIEFLQSKGFCVYANTYDNKIHVR